jgi:hypothetical protein
VNGRKYLGQAFGHRRNSRARCSRENQRYDLPARNMPGARGEGNAGFAAAVEETGEDYACSFHSQYGRRFSENESRSRGELGQHFPYDFVPTTTVGRPVALTNIISSLRVLWITVESGSRLNMATFDPPSPGSRPDNQPSHPAPAPRPSPMIHGTAMYRTPARRLVLPGMNDQKTHSPVRCR